MTNIVSLIAVMVTSIVTNVTETYPITGYLPGKCPDAKPGFACLAIHYGDPIYDLTRKTVRTEVGQKTTLTFDFEGERRTVEKFRSLSVTNETFQIVQEWRRSPPTNRMPEIWAFTNVLATSNITWMDIVVGTNMTNILIR